MVKKFTIPFASQGDANDIPDALQVDGKVSFTQGFGYDYERPYDDPQAKDIAREDMNGIFKAITSAVGELQTLGASEWSSAIAYPKGAIVYFEKDLYISQIDDNQTKPPQSWTSIKNIADDSLKKAMNLSDLTNKTTARNNLGLGSSATLNKTDVLGTSKSLVATQKLVNDTKINLERSKQDKLTFVGDGPDVMRAGAFGLGGYKATSVEAEEDYLESSSNRTTETITFPSSLQVGGRTIPSYTIGWRISRNNGGQGLKIFGHDTRLFFGRNNVREVYTDYNTTTDKSGFLRAKGSANALTESDRTSSLGTSSTLVATQKLVNDVSTRTTTAQSRADSAYTLANSKITGGSVVQSTGTSTTNVMSQKAVSDLVKLNTASKSQNGWWKCGDTGVIRQWGVVDVGDDEYKTFSFPIAFPNKCTTLISTLNFDKITDSAASNGTHNHIIDNTEFGVGASSGMSDAAVKGFMGVYWEATGY